MMWRDLAGGKCICVLTSAVILNKCIGVRYMNKMSRLSAEIRCSGKHLMQLKSEMCKEMTQGGTRAWVSNLKTPKRVCSTRYLKLQRVCEVMFCLFLAMPVRFMFFSDFLYLQKVENLASGKVLVRLLVFRQYLT